MSGLTALGPSGPFDRQSSPAWFFHEDGVVRVLDLPGYLTALVDSGTELADARDLTGRMEAHGALSILWAAAHGGRRGHLTSAWDVRVATTTTPATDAVAEITGGPQLPAGAATVASLEGCPQVLAAYTHPVEPRKVRLPSAAGPAWSRALRLPAQVHHHATVVAYAALTVDDVGATVTVFGDRRSDAERQLRFLTDVVLDDIARSIAARMC